MPAYAEVIYNPTAAYIASLNNDDTYDAPVQIDYLGKLSFEFEADQDELMSGGMIVEMLAIPKKVTGEITQGALNMAAMSTMCGYTFTEYSTTPNRYGILQVKTGGAGMPYFGLIVSYASTLGGNLLAGFPKAMLDTMPGFDVDQNKFRIGNANFSGVAPSQNIRIAALIKKNETAASIPTTAQGFLDFFTIPIPVFD